jgi:hypothetical protein
MRSGGRAGGERHGRPSPGMAVRGYDAVADSIW